MPRFNDINPLGIIAEAQELPTKKDPVFSDADIATLTKLVDIACIDDGDIYLGGLRDRLFQVLGNWDTGCKFKMVGEK